MVDVRAVRLGERCAFDEENILGVELGAPREVDREKRTFAAACAPPAGMAANEKILHPIGRLVAS